MKVTIANKRNSDWSDAKSGKGFFVQRLISELRKLGLEITTDRKEPSDVSLHLSKFVGKVNSKKRVLRLGAIHIDKASKWKKLNKENEHSYHNADGVIYQSAFSKRLVQAFWGGGSCPDTVIPNAADPRFYAQIEPCKSDFKRNILCCTREWLPQKRLDDIVEAFKIADIPDCAIWVAGNAEVKDRHYNSVKQVGKVDQQTLGSLYRMADVMVHIVWIDACPNAVCEALAAGCPVICNANGGTRELIRGHGMVLSLEEPYNFKPVNLQKPPDANLDSLASAMRSFATKRVPRKVVLDIRDVAKKYAEFFWTLNQ